MKQVNKESIWIISIFIWLGHWIASMLDVIVGLISTITFCIWRPNWDFSFRIFWSKRIIYHKMKRNKKNEKT